VPPSSPNFACVHEHHVTVGRRARYYTLGDAGRSPRELWVVCHGYGQLAARFLEHFAPLDDGSRLIVAPEGLSRFYLGTGVGPDEKVGASWMTRADRLAEIDDYVAYLDAVHADVGRAGAAPLHTLGFSQGAATVSRWAVMGRAGPRRLTLWGGELPPDLDLAAAGDVLRGLDLTLVCGRQDPLITAKVVDRGAARLAEHRIPHRVIWFDGGHEIDEPTLRRLAADA
jgi:predicted esterase